MILDYLNLTKPRISLLFAFTGFAVLFVAGLPQQPLHLFLLTLGIFLTGGSANVFNQYLERDRDLLMERTAKKRPLPQGKISPSAALVFGIVAGLCGLALLWVWGSFWAFLSGVGTIAFYSFYYTLYLKPRTPYNIVIGGIPGAMGPIIASAALNGGVKPLAILLFLVIFFWTPPHFWALALCCKDDYAKVGIPMLPLVLGDEATRRQILGYSFFLLPLSLSIYLLNGIGLIYLLSACLLSGVLLAEAWRVYKRKTIQSYWRFFGYSIVYLLLIFTMVILDSIW